MLLIFSFYSRTTNFCKLCFFYLQITNKFNELLLNDPEDNRLVYTIRDQLITPSLGIVTKEQLMAAAQINSSVDMKSERDESDSVLPRGFARKIHVRSRCFDASLVIDGGMSFSFNDGTRALLEMNSSDTLRNVVLDESETMVSFKH